jgi:hypothetical protein
VTRPWVAAVALTSFVKLFFWDNKKYF